MSKILIVDDNPLGLMLVTGIIMATKTEGLEVLSARNAMDALIILERNTVDMLFTDLHMNEMSGLQLIQRLRKKGITIPIVVVTMEESPEMLKRVLEAGATMVMSKRSKPADLQKALELVGKSA
jgi:two-component system capsular synthesis sensor histidine kinase RcsC